MPSNPDKFYKEWTNWYDFLGTIRPIEFISFEKAKAAISKLREDGLIINGAEDSTKNG
ncbi:MAG: hypothetical protein ACW98D_19140 [Promethearchaeota archaeon]